MDKSTYLKKSLKETNERITTLIYLKNKYKSNKEFQGILQKELNICFYKKDKLNLKIKK